MYFFNKQDIGHLGSEISKVQNCKSCGLYKNCISPKMKPTGKGKKKILIIGEAPGKNEDKKGIQLIGQSGQLLREVLKDLNIDLDRDCIKTNSIICRPPKNKTANKKQVAACRQNVWRCIKENKPKLIILLGGIAVQSFLDDRWDKDLGGINKWRGFLIPDRKADCWIMSTYHPSYVLKNEHKEIVYKTFKNDIKKAIKNRNKKIKYDKNELSKVEVITDESLLTHRLKAFIALQPEITDLLAIDYETSGLKPYAEGHYIHTCSLSYGPDHALSFPMPNKKSKAFKLYKKIITNKNLKKTGHNIKFEDVWSNTIHNIQIQNWYWDSMLAAHLIDGRSKITSLDFQAYINFGITPYSGKIKKYLLSNDKNANSFNTINKAPIRDLLLYGGQDTMYQFRLAIKQMKIVGYDIPKYLKRTV